MYIHICSHIKPHKLKWCLCYFWAACHGHAEKTCMHTWKEETVTLKGNTGGQFEFKKQGIPHFKQRLSFHTRALNTWRLVENVKHSDSSQYALEHTSHYATVQWIYWEQLQQATAAPPYHCAPQLFNKEMKSFGLQRVNIFGTSTVSKHSDPVWPWI